MSKFHFKLQSYLNVKEKVENQKKIEYGRTLARLEIEKHKKERIIAKQVEQVKACKEKIYRGITSNEYFIYQTFLESLKKQATQQEEKILQVKQVAEEKRELLVSAMKERKMLEKLRENEYIKFRKEQLIEEQKQVDETVSYRFNNRRE